MLQIGGIVYALFWIGVISNSVMNENPQVVTELLAPIPGGSPAGGEDLSTVEAYVKLDAEMSKPAPDYANCITWATQVLRSNSKNIKVAAWLGFAWYRTEKFAGLKNGVLLAAALLEKYADKLFPANSMHRSKAVQFLNTDKVTKLLAKEQVTAQAAQDVIALNAALKRLTAICGQQFPQNGPNLTALAQVIEAHLKVASNQLSVNSDQSAVDSNQSSVSSNQSPVITDQQPQREQPATSHQSKRSGDPASAGQPATPAGAASDQQSATSPDFPLNDTEGKSGEPELELPDEVAALLKPISAKAPAGKDLANAHEPDYFNLKSEIAKVKPDYDKCIALASDLLKSRTKDVEVMLSLCFAWYRKENITGLKNGLLLLLKALQQFSGKLYPSDPNRRGKAFNFLTTKQVARMLVKERVVEANAKAMLTLNEVFQRFQKEFLQQFPPEAAKSGKDPRPSFLKEFEETLKGHVKDAEELLKPPPEKKPEPLVEPLSETPAKQRTTETTTKPPTSSPVSTATTIASDRDALAAMKKR
jgi:predicted component of type VI protein secretion system